MSSFKNISHARARLQKIFALVFCSSAIGAISGVLLVFYLLNRGNFKTPSQGFKQKANWTIRLSSPLEMMEADMDLGLKLVAQNKYEAARKMFLELLLHQPNDPTLLNNLAYVESALGNDPQAIGHLEKSISLSPNCAECLNNLGALLLKNDGASRAKELLEKATLENPSYTHPVLNLGILHEKQSRWSEALKWYQIAEKSLTADKAKEWVRFRILLLTDLQKFNAVERKLTGEP